MSELEESKCIRDLIEGVLRHHSKEKNTIRNLVFRRKHVAALFPLHSPKELHELRMLCLGVPLTHFKPWTLPIEKIKVGK